MRERRLHRAVVVATVSRDIATAQAARRHGPPRHLVKPFIHGAWPVHAGLAGAYVTSARASWPVAAAGIVASDEVREPFVSRLSAMVDESDIGAARGRDIALTELTEDQAVAQWRPAGHPED